MRDYRYVTEGTFDAYSYQTVERKQRFISQLMSSKSPAREAADLDADVVTLANIKALATGDPDIQRRMTLENEINQLKLLRASWAQQKADTRRDIGQQLQPRVELLRQSIREKADDKPLASKALGIHQTARMNGRWEGMTINGQPVGDRQTACRLLHQAAHQAHDGDTIAEYDGLPVIARRADTTGRITLAVKAVHEHESGTEMPGPYLTGPSSIVSQLDRLVRNMATDPGKLAERLADAERELAAAQETLAEPFAHEDEYRQKQAELERLTSKPDEPRETESRDQETTKTERSARMPLTREDIGRLLEQDPNIDGITQGGNAWDTTSKPGSRTAAPCRSTSTTTPHGRTRTVWPAGSRYSTPTGHRRNGNTTTTIWPTANTPSSTPPNPTRYRSSARRWPNGNARAASTRPAHPSRATWPRTSRRRNTPTGGGNPGTPTGTSHT